jgi:hypothetical protein
VHPTGGQPPAADLTICRAAAALVDGSAANVVRWSQRTRGNEVAAAKPMGGNQPFVLAGERTTCWCVDPEAGPDAARFAGRAAKRGGIVACDTPWRFYGRKGSA